MYEQTYSTKIFRIFKVNHRVPQPVYDLSGLQNRPIEYQFYNYELVKVTLSPQTEFHIDKIVHTRSIDGIKQHVVKLRGYEAT